MYEKASQRCFISLLDDKGDSIASWFADPENALKEIKRAFKVNESAAFASVSDVDGVVVRRLARKP